MKYIKRQMEDSIIEASKQFPVVMVCGQRQTGKSTMLRHITEKDRRYVSFDDAKTRELAFNDPQLFFEIFGKKLLIDEFQRVPSILLEIKHIVDNEAYEGRDNSGMFWLSGSQKFLMMKKVSESLAGRVAIFNLLPMSQREINETISKPFYPEINALKNREFKPETMVKCFENIFKGGMPALFSKNDMNRDLYYSSYMNTYIERDISSLEQVGKLDEFRTFVTYIAANTAQELNYNSISKAVGVSVPTVKEWITILERSGIIYILRPYCSNISKRLVKTPKVYFIDTGLASYLTSWPNAETLMNGNSSGAFLETFVVGEILKGYCNCGIEPALYYYRDVDKKEIDLIMAGAGWICPIEIKKAKQPSNPTKNFTVLNKFKCEIKPGIILCMCNELFPISRKSWLCPIGLI